MVRDCVRGGSFTVTRGAGVSGRGMTPKYLSDPGPKLRRIEVPHDHEHGVVGPVISRMKLPHFFQAGGIERLNISNRGKLVRVGGKRLLLDKLAKFSVWFGKHPLPVFLFHHFSLQCEIPHIHGEFREALRLGPEQPLQVIRGNDFEKNGDVVGGISIVLAAHIFREPVEKLRGHSLRAFEHDVFKQVRKPAAPGGIVLRSDAKPYLDSRGGRRVIFQPDEMEPIRERLLLIV